MQSAIERCASGAVAHPCAVCVCVRRASVAKEQIDRSVATTRTTTVRRRGSWKTEPGVMELIAGARRYDRSVGDGSVRRHQHGDRQPSTEANAYDNREAKRAYDQYSSLALVEYYTAGGPRARALVSVAPTIKTASGAANGGDGVASRGSERSTEGWWWRRHGAGWRRPPRRQRGETILGRREDKDRRRWRMLRRRDFRLSVVALAPDWPGPVWINRRPGSVATIDGRRSSAAAFVVKTTNFR